MYQTKVIITVQKHKGAQQQSKRHHNLQGAHVLAITLQCHCHYREQLTTQLAKQAERFYPTVRPGQDLDR